MNTTNCMFIQKDFKNRTIVEMVKKSNKFCLMQRQMKEKEAEVAAGDEMIKEPCRIVCHNSFYQKKLEEASKRLNKDGFIHSKNFDTSNSTKDTFLRPEPTTSFTKTISILKNAMQKLSYGLYRGNIYKKNKLGKSFFLISL